MVGGSAVIQADNSSASDINVTLTEEKNNSAFYQSAYAGSRILNEKLADAFKTAINGAPTSSKPIIAKEIAKFNPSADYFQNVGEQYAPRGMYDPARNAITLFSGADFSTLIHESGHYWLDHAAILRRIGQRVANVKSVAGC